MRLLFIGRLTPYKDPLTLVDAVDILGENYEADIVGARGGSAYETLLRERAGERVTIHDWVEWSKTDSFYERADLYVMPSRWPEPLSRTVLEALGHGLPIACSTAGGSMWASGGACICFPPSDPDAIAKVIDESEEELDDLARRAPKALERFSADNVIGRLETAYGGT